MTAAPDSAPVLAEDALPAVLVTMNRARSRNALSTEMMEALTLEIERQAARPEVRVIVLRGDGPAFSAGHDLREMLDRSQAEEQAIFDTCVTLMEAVQAVPVPVIAMVHGIATAAGCQLVASCDLAIASEEARFATPGVNIGLFCSTPSVAVARSIGRKRALQMLLTGEPVDARTAAEWGLINEVVPAAELERRTLELANRIAGASPLTLRIGKQAFYRQVDETQAEAYRDMAGVMAENAMAADAQEGMSAFLEKRTPTWRGE